MKRISINTTVALSDFGRQKQLKVLINKDIGTQFCMGILMLREELTETLSLEFKNFSFVFKLSNDRYSYADIFLLKDKIFKGRVSIDAVEYIMHYLLKFYRDDVAEAEHIDVDFIADDNTEYTLTIVSNDYQEYSEDEIRELLK